MGKKSNEKTIIIHSMDLLDELLVDFQLEFSNNMYYSITIQLLHCLHTDKLHVEIYNMQSKFASLQFISICMYNVFNMYIV